MIVVTMKTADKAPSPEPLRHIFVSHPVLLDQEGLGSGHSQSVVRQLLFCKWKRAEQKQSPQGLTLSFQTAPNYSPRAAVSPGRHFGWASGGCLPETGGSFEYIQFSSPPTSCLSAS